MNRFTLFFTAMLAFLCQFDARAQSLSITSQPPDALVVCDNDTLRVTLTNTSGAPVTGIALTVELPAGTSYLPGSVANAAEQNISVPNQPVFTTANLAPGADITIALLMSADCDLVKDINSGAQFTNTIRADYNGGSDETTSSAYIIETGFIVIVSVNPLSQSGERGDVLTREIRFRNTRLGKIGRLRLIDQHFPGYTAFTPGAAVQDNPSDVWFEAEFDGSFFSTIGDGDEWLEFNEEGVITEEITITDCGVPPFDNPSLLRLSWGCDGDVCQYDSLEAEISIETSTQNPDLSFTWKYAPPASNCGDAPAFQELTLVNNGNVDATDVSVELRRYSAFDGFDPNGFSYDDGNGFQPLTANLNIPGVLPDCDLPIAIRSLLLVPLVKAQSSTTLRFTTLTCAPPCSGSSSLFSAFTLYNKTCPESAAISDSIAIYPDTIEEGMSIRPLHKLNYCMVEDSSYSFSLLIQDATMDSDTGYLQLFFDLPKGIYWSDDCDLSLDGQQPVLVTEEDIEPMGTRRVLLAYQLPFSTDSVSLNYCLTYACQPDMPCEDLGAFDPVNGGSVMVFPEACPDSCALKVKALGAIATSPNAAFGCGRNACEDWLLFVEDFCNGGGGGGGGGGPFAGLLTAQYQVYRLNLGLEDNNNDQFADSDMTADSLLVRRDRYIPGDTLRLDLKGLAIAGSIEQIPFKLFFEAIESQLTDNGGDLYELGLSRNRLTNYDSLMFLSGALRIKRADGTISSCPVLYSARAHRQFVTISEINTEPMPILDRLVTMNHRFDLDFISCAGAPLQAGDSIFLILDFKFLQNFVPAIAPQAPSLINFRAPIWNVADDYVWEKALGPLGQYSGYLESFIYPEQSIRPCTTSTEISPFSYRIRLARGNMFPFEVRPLARISNFRYLIPPNTVLEKITSDLVLQENTPWLTDIDLPWSLNGSEVLADYGPMFSDPVDEGFFLQSSHLFAPSCIYQGPDSALVQFDLWHPECFPGPTITMKRNVEQLGFFDGLPNLVFEFTDSILYLPAPNADLDFLIRNTKFLQAPNAWLYIEPLNGALDNLELIRLPQQQPIPGIAGFYQLGNLPGQSSLSLRLGSNNNNCGPLLLRMVVGWDCEPVSSHLNNTCGRDTVVVDLRLLNAVLELDILNQPDEVPLCAPSDFITIEVSNANDGNGFNLRPSIKLPQGLSVVNGTTEVSYPAGSPFVPTADPALSTGNVFQWKLAEILPALAAGGLPGFQTQPANTFRLRFRVQAECGFVANAQPIYGLEGIQPCGITTNILRKPDDPINLAGISEPYNVDISITPVNNAPLYCGSTKEISVQLLVQGAPSPGDSIVVQLPAGVAYVPGSYTPVQNAAAGPPTLSGQTLRLPFPPGLTAGTQVRFRLTVQYDETADCIDRFIVIQARQGAQGFCETTGQFCGVFVATGESLYQLPIQNPDLVVENVTADAPNAGVYPIAIQLGNPGGVPAPQAVVQFWLDLNGNGQPDAGDQLLETLSYNQTLPPGSSASLTGQLNLQPNQLCRVLAVLPAAENCACAPKVYPIDEWSIDQGVLARCEVEPIELGIDSIAGNTYTWQPGGLVQCGNCAATVFNPGPGVVPGDGFVFVLLEQAGNCVIEHQFEVRFADELGIETPDQTVCRGDSVVLSATPGGAYLWSGPGINNPGLQTQILFPEQPASYSVTVTLADGCTGTDVVNVNVLPSSQTDLGALQTCAGQPVDIFGQSTDVPGVYTATLSAANGCDSVVTIRLEVFGVEGQSEADLCEGESLSIFDTLVNAAGNYCRTFTNAAGCDSIHCINVALLPGFNLPEPDSVIIALGDSIQLQAPAGFVSYEWTPSAGLSCTACPSPWAMPDTSTTFTVKVENPDGCHAEAAYRVLVFPPCDPARLQIPNAITPNGDGTNDVFRIVPVDEGFEVVGRLTIFDRWGEKVYESASQPQWDATIDGQPAPTDTYVYIFEVLCNGTDEKIVGDVTVIR